MTSDIPIQSENSERPPRARHARSGQSRWTWRRRIAFALACAAIAAGIGIGGRILLYLHHSQATGQALVHQEERKIAKANASGQCSAATASSAPTTTSTNVTIPSGQQAGATPSGSSNVEGQQVQLVLKIPKLGLVAPVLQGVDDSQLNVGVGHVPSSSWPGLAGTDVLSAHDVTWFSEIDRLDLGDHITIVTPCHTFGYTVLSHSVVRSGSPVYQTAEPRLILVTCYPLNALFFTPNRYLVQATLTQLTTQGVVTAPPSTVTALPAVPAPPALAAQHLDLAHNEQPLGVLSFSGTPSTDWLQGPGPLQAEAVCLELYFAALRTGRQNVPSWWNAIAPGVPFASTSHLRGAAIGAVTGPVHPTLNVAGSTLTGVTITASVRLLHNDAPGTYVITMAGSVVGGQLVITGFSVQPAA
jgi:sortase A